MAKCLCELVATIWGTPSSKNSFPVVLEAPGRAPPVPLASASCHMLPSFSK